MSGSILAAQLSKHPNVKVTLLERFARGALPPGLNLLLNHNGIATIKALDPPLACGILRGHSAWVTDLAHLGVHLASASYDMTVRVWRCDDDDGEGGGDGADDVDEEEALPPVVQEKALARAPRPGDSILQCLLSLPPRTHLCV